ncbi:DNA-binding transcriptional LysR family regulator [Paucibacter oligotrophus]|uniref:DNA-binding transcriptional LysR family regulator n=1 Tax=Roseateles oligotrophus TaxID=1769250 RepID=A0A840LJ68_9BURK|nr:LysR family transcriptional regulator [Roseateles oligotrophus]MBB4846258.1 DNA-binding transcriptional LysR family regulator [Roseateles oligotrophus]
MRVEYKQLAIFVAVADGGTLGHASEQMHLTQAAVSMQLRALQERLNITLVVRNGRGLTLTEEGLRLLPKAREALGSAQAFERAVGAPLRALAVEAAPLNIGTILDPNFIRLGELLAGLSATLPQRRPELRQGTSGWVRRELRAGRLDVGFYLGDSDDKQFRRQQLARLRYVVIGPRGWRGRMRGDWQALAQLPWIWTPPDSVHNRLLSPIFRGLGLRPRVAASVDQEASMLDLVRAGLGLSLAREDVALRESHQSGLSLLREPGLETDLSLIAPLQARDAGTQESVELVFAAARRIWL